VRTRTDIGVGEYVKLLAVNPQVLPVPFGVIWSTTAGTITLTNGPASGLAAILTALDTAQKITATAGAATKDFNVIAPTSVAMDREPSTGVTHTKDRPDSGIATRVFLGPDRVNFYGAIFHELDVGAAATGVYSCNPFTTGHCAGSGGPGNPCPDKALTTTVVGGKGTQALIGDCAYSGDCCTAAAPFVPGIIAFTIPYEYKVGAGPFHKIRDVDQLHILTPVGSTLATRKAGAFGSTTVAAATATIAACPYTPCP
jgi:hypothetical protein